MTIPVDDPFRGYVHHPYFCELANRGADDGGTRVAIMARIAAIGLDALRARAAAAENELINLGVTFTVYSDATAIDRILPFDCIPRILTAAEWRHAGSRREAAGGGAERLSARHLPSPDRSSRTG